MRQSMPNRLKVHIGSLADIQIITCGKPFWHFFKFVWHLYFIGMVMDRPLCSYGAICFLHIFFVNWEEGYYLCPACTVTLHSHDITIHHITVLHCSECHCTVLDWIGQDFNGLHWTGLGWIALIVFVLCCGVLYWTALCYTVLCDIVYTSPKKNLIDIGSKKPTRTRLFWRSSALLIPRRRGVACPSLNPRSTGVPVRSCSLPRLCR